MVASDEWFDCWGFERPIGTAARKARFVRGDLVEDHVAAETQEKTLSLNVSLYIKLLGRPFIHGFETKAAVVFIGSQLRTGRVHDRCFSVQLFGKSVTCLCYFHVYLKKR